MKKSLFAAGALSLIVAAVALVPRPAASAGAAAKAPRPHLPGKFVWFDLLTNDAKAAEAYYGGLFGWTFEVLKDHEPPYKIIRDKGQPIGGVVDMTTRKEQLPESTWLGYVSVPDVDAAAAAFKEKGGAVLKAPFDVARLARAAVVTDPQHALLGLIHIAKGDPPDTPPASGRFLWIEHMAKDAPAAMAFYHDVLGYDAKPLDAGVAGVDFAYYALGRGGKNRAGLYATPWKDLNSNWLPYVLVADAAAAAEKAKALGGRVVLAPSPDTRDGSLAIVVDPTGAALALQKYPFEKSGK
ncbi:MAG TPA: VOC family protein [Thermoanaerobaculia bacterium]|nr:VOC family protein [Thermoanaerobaculia bacterium]